MPKTPSEQISRDEEIDSMQGRWKYVEELRAERDELRIENDAIKKWLDDNLEDYDLSALCKDIEKSVARIKKMRQQIKQLKKETCYFCDRNPCECHTHEDIADKK